MLGSVQVRAVASSASLAFVLAVSPSHAQAVASVRVTYQAPPDCGSQAEFEARVRGRTRSRTLEPTGEARPTLFEVSVRRDQERVLGSLTIHEASGDANTREIEAASCSEAVDGLALIAALTLDPTSTLRPEPDPPPEPAPKAAPPPIVSQPAAEPKPSPEVDDEADDEREAPFRIDLSMSVLGASGVAPENLAGIEGAVGFFSTAAMSTGSLVRFGVRKTATDDERIPEGTATLEWIAFHLELCPALLPIGEVFWITGCVASEYGELSGQGRDTDNPRRKTAPWVALGPELLARLEVLSPLFLQLGGDLLFPLNRDRFLLADAEVYAIPAVSGRVQGGLGVRFW